MWETPQDLFDELDKEFHFNLDVCAIPENAKCKAFYTPEQDGLNQPWKGTCWCNPPYGREVGQWVRRALFASIGGATVVMLLPARTDTKWWWDWVQGKATLFFIKGRVKFGDHNVGAPFPSVLALYMKDFQG